MSDAATVLATGSCRCGAVEMTLTAPPFMTAACHCRGCQQMSASAFSLTAMVPADALSVTKGETRRGGKGEGMLDHRQCVACGSWLFTRLAGQDFVNIRPVHFDRPDWCRPFIETMCDARLDWASTPARHSFAQFPPADSFAALIRAYAEERG